MKRSELVEGAEYAVGRSGHYDTWKRAHVRVVKVDAERQRPSGTPERGILVEFVEDSRTYGHFGSAGEQQLLTSSRDIQQPWEEYVEAKRAHEERQRERQAERDRVSMVASRAIDTLESYGFRPSTHFRYSDSTQTFTFRPERLDELLAVVRQEAHHAA